MKTKEAYQQGLRTYLIQKFYIHVLKQDWDVNHIPRPRKERSLPGVLSQQEVQRLIEHLREPRPAAVGQGGKRRSHGAYHHRNPASDA